MMKPEYNKSMYVDYKKATKMCGIVFAAFSLSACSTMSLSDFGLGGSDNKKSTATVQDSAPPQRHTVTSVKKEEPGMWDRVTGWFSSDDKAAPKGDNLAKTQTAPSRTVQTTNAANASLRAAQDVSKLNNVQSAQQRTIIGPVPQSHINTSRAATSPVITPAPPNKPISISSPQTGHTSVQRIDQKSSQALATTAHNAQASTTAQSNTAQQLAQNNAPVAQPQTEESFWGKIGSFFSSDNNKQVAKSAPVSKSPSAVNSFARQATNIGANDVEDGSGDLTPVQTLRLARQSTRTAQASSQGLTPYAPNPSAPTKLADANIKTDSVTPKIAPKTVQTNTPKITSPKVAVKPINQQKTTRVAAVSPANRVTSQKTSYVVTPETYRANNSTSVSRAPVGNLENAAPNQNAFKFFFNPGSADLAPHHIAQLRGLAGQAIARQRKITILGTSNPGGEAGKGASALALQNIATARAMAAARNLQKFGVPSNMINMRIAQSTTPSEIGTGGNKTLRTMTARRVEVSIQ